MARLAYRECAGKQTENTFLKLRRFGVACLLSNLWLFWLTRFQSVIGSTGSHLAPRPSFLENPSFQNDYDSPNIFFFLIHQTLKKSKELSKSNTESVCACVYTRVLEVSLDRCSCTGLCMHELRGGCLVCCCITPHLVPLRQGFSPKPGAKLVASRLQRTFGRHPPKH